MDEMMWLMEKHGLTRNDISSFCGGLIPIGGMKNIISRNDAILIGDAGGFTNPISKGGIVGALVSGKEGGRAVSDLLSGDEDSLSKWRKGMENHPAFNPINLQRRDILSSLDDKLLDDLTSIVRGRNLWTIRKTEILKEAWKRPELMKIGRKTYKLAKGGKEWAMWAF
jgi:flavin-dependent dehydrogenase